MLTFSEDITLVKPLRLNSSPISNCRCFKIGHLLFRRQKLWWMAILTSGGLDIILNVYILIRSLKNGAD